jgi:glycosyltransferase involved in cell wall biosynthesis
LTDRLRVLFVTHYYPPEVGAPQTRLHETALRLASLSIDVRVLTGQPHYPGGLVRDGYRAWRPRRETIDGIGVIRLPMIARPNGGLLDRSVDHGSFAAMAMLAIPAIRWADVLLVESPPLFLGLTAAFHRLLTRRPYVFHVADPWPDFPIAMGALRSPFGQRLAFANESLAYRFASRITTVTAPLVARLDRKPSARGKVELLPNGVALDRFAPTASPADERRALGWDAARLTLVYAGTVGLAQGLGTLIDAMAALRGSGVVVHVVGDGAERAEIEARVRDRGLDSVRVHDPVPPDRVPALLAAADAVLVLLRRGPLFEESLPTKLVEGLAAGRPLLVSADGEAVRIVVASRAGRVAPAEDATALAAAIVAMRDAPDRQEMGHRARAAAEADYDRARIVGRLAGLLAAAAGLERSTADRGSGSSDAPGAEPTDPGQGTLVTHDPVAPQDQHPSR